MRVKYLTIGLAAGAVMATAGTSLADSVHEKVTATIRSDFGLEIDGQAIELENAPMAYNGASYLPVRELSELLGKDVDFKDGTITLSEKEDPDMDEWISITELSEKFGLQIGKGPNPYNVMEIKKGEELLLSIDVQNGANPVHEYGETPSGEKVRVKIHNYRLYVNEDDLRATGIIQ